ncbi:MAG: restriction endonuclease subunit S [Gammaproteobacteria bacterium]|nr:restriction endonuclease subunit S [Gammaproteobacteria bacterium]
MTRYPQVPLGDICTVNPRAGKTACLDDTSVSFVPMAAVDESAGEIAVRQQRPFAEVAKGYTSFEDGDILFAKITPCMENGKVALARNLANGIGRGSTEFHVLRPGERALGEYIYHFVRQPGFREEAKRNFTGTAGQQRVPKQFMQNASIPLPSLDEQRRIVAILNRAAKIERLKKQAQEQLREFIPALFVKMFGDPAKNPMEWPMQALGDLCEMDRNTIKPSDLGASELRFVGVENVDAGAGTLNFGTNSRVGGQKSTAFRFDQRHVLYGKLRPYLNKVATPDFDGKCSTELIPFLPRDGVNRDFLAALLRRKETVAYAMKSVTGSRMPRTDMNSLLAMRIPVPPLAAQQQFAKIVETAQAAATAVETGSVTASRLSDALMSWLLKRGAAAQDGLASGLGSSKEVG